MSDATLWIDEVGCTVLVKNGSAIHILPLWVFESMRDIIVAEAEKKVEVTHRDFDIQQELLDRYRSENAKLQASNEVIAEDHAALCEQNAKLRDALKALMMGTNVELCADRDALQCQECSMALDEHRCVMSDAILLLGIDMYGEPL